MRRATAAPPGYCTLVQKMGMFMQGIFRAEGGIVRILFWSCKYSHSGSLHARFPFLVGMQRIESYTIV